jgi:hypothetical protein
MGGRGGRAGAGGPAPLETASFAPQPTIAAAKRNLPTGETFASAADAPTPKSAPKKPQVVAERETPTDASDASPVTLSGPIAALYLAPMPPKRPADLATTQVAALDAPLPPTRPPEMAFAAPLPPTKPPAEASAAGPDNLVAMLESNNLPRVMTRGLKPIPSGALALAETPKLDDQALLDRAAGLYAVLPPAPDADVTGSTTPAHGLSVVKRSRDGATAPTSGNVLAFGDLNYDAFRTPPPTLILSAQGLGELRGSAP